MSEYKFHPENEFSTRGEFTETCDCGKPYSIFTQADDNPEYYTVVELVCADCDRRVVFELPLTERNKMSLQTLEVLALVFFIIFLIRRM
jgi:hypothetical protein